MALIARGGLFERLSPLVQAKRFRGKINIQRPKPVHRERSIMMTLTNPFFISTKKGKTPIDLCTKSQDKIVKDEHNPYQQIIAGELRMWFNTSRLIAFYHLNPMKSDQRFKAYAMFKKSDMLFKQYGKKTLEIAVKDTKFEPVLDFYVSQNIMVFSPQPEVKKLLKITKRFPQLVLLAAIFEGKFVSKDELIELEKIPNLQTAQAALVQTLNSAATTIHQQLNQHQSTLVSQLEQRIKQLE
ncbi:large ribosomal subunit protein uL10m [Tribolium castaneum]|uniref:Large ribosomal subunit protein uL10m n=1 Tax=Tribolium castaneum TaxID=7070 RepID=D6WKZ4_TRICA|nr:PREDICTED: 39S ribosomal protein L10, mitochondrial [Tribolium castaneum]EFA04041.1 39S ribosomal protein L10, mitochondrial-like Protein [Tribolium castaneum]|eukprot:XP_969776.1 PREDICTED: 39S ribosomal protein L10, mitochondrial [Tribolium castaneum]